MRSIEGGIQAYLRDPAVNNTGVLSGTQMNRFVNSAGKQVVLCSQRGKRLGEAP